jgi:hypothetical protein
VKYTTGVVAVTPVPAGAAPKVSMRAAGEGIAMRTEGSGNVDPRLRTRSRGSESQPTPPTSPPGAVAARNSSSSAHCFYQLEAIWEPVFKVSVLINLVSDFQSWKLMSICVGSRINLTNVMRYGLSYGCASADS